MGRIRYGLKFPPSPIAAGRMEACRRLAERFGEPMSKLREAEKRLDESIEELEPAMEERQRFCEADPHSHKCWLVNHKLELLHDKEEKARNDIRKYRALCGDAEQRMEDLGCEEIFYRWGE